MLEKTIDLKDAEDASGLAEGLSTFAYRVADFRVSHMDVLLLSVTHLLVGSCLGSRPRHHDAVKRYTESGFPASPASNP